MALTNIELYEALKKDVSEDAARMIAEAVPKAEDIATKGDLAELKERIVQLELTIERRFSEFEQRAFRYAMVFGAPLWAAMIAALVRFALKA
jgi:hypothetical protein